MRVCANGSVGIWRGALGGAQRQITARVEGAGEGRGRLPVGFRVRARAVVISAWDRPRSAPRASGARLGNPLQVTHAGGRLTLFDVALHRQAQQSALAAG